MPDTIEAQIKAISDHIKMVDLEIGDMLEERDSGPQVIAALSKKCPPMEVAAPGDPQDLWQSVGLYYKWTNRPYEALAVFQSLYTAMLLAQDETRYVHKGMPLVWISDCFSHIGFPLHAKRYLMLTLCEDAINWKGVIPADTTGAYFRLVWHHGLPESDFRQYATSFWDLYNSNPSSGLYPEALLQAVDDHWQTALPSGGEAFYYTINKSYAKHLLSKLPDKTGIALERLAEYLLSCMPGCRTKRRLRSSSTDYDVVCSMEGLDVDFRSELGRYFVCECKDWESPADFTTIAKFCRVLDSTKSRFGILFTRGAISGTGQTLFAERERLKVYQDRSIVIAVITQENLNRVADGMNLIWLLREQYESIRLDLRRIAG